MPWRRTGPKSAGPGPSPVQCAGAKPGCLAEPRPRRWHDVGTTLAVSVGSKPSKKHVWNQTEPRLERPFKANMLHFRRSGRDGRPAPSSPFQGLIRKDRKSLEAWDGTNRATLCPGFDFFPRIHLILFQACLAGRRRQEEVSASLVGEALHQLLRIANHFCARLFDRNVEENPREPICHQPQIPSVWRKSRPRGKGPPAHVQLSRNGEKQPDPPPQRGGISHFSEERAAFRFGGVGKHKWNRKAERSARVVHPLRKPQVVGFLGHLSKEGQGF